MPIFKYRARGIISKLYISADLRKRDKQIKHTLNIYLEKLYRSHFLYISRQIIPHKFLKAIAELFYPTSFFSLLTLNTFSTRKKGGSTQHKYLFSEAMRTGSLFFTLRSCKHRSYLPETIFHLIAKLISLT